MPPRPRNPLTTALYSILVSIALSILVGIGLAAVFFKMIADHKDFVSAHPQLLFLMEKPATTSAIVGVVCGIASLLVAVRRSDSKATLMLASLIYCIPAIVFLSLLLRVEISSCCDIRETQTVTWTAEPAAACLLEADNDGYSLAIWEDDSGDTTQVEQMGYLNPGHLLPVLYHNGKVEDRWWLVEIPMEMRQPGIVSMNSGWDDKRNGWVNGQFADVSDHYACSLIPISPEKE
jgi:hypothetical protein